MGSGAQQTDSPSAPSAIPVPPQKFEQKPIIEENQHISDAPAIVSVPPAVPGHSILSREEKVEYRDQDGNLLDDEQVKALEGKVSFKTRYETRTRVVDPQGNEIGGFAEEAGVAPPHPDVEGVDRETVAVAEPNAHNDKPASRSDVQADESKEESVIKSNAGAAKPASEGNEATA